MTLKVKSEGRVADGFGIKGPCLYVASFANGVVKIGRSENVDRRIAQLRYTFKTAPIIETFALGPVENMHGKEYMALIRLRRIALRHRQGKEFFVGISARQAAQVLFKVSNDMDRAEERRRAWKRVNHLMDAAWEISLVRTPAPAPLAA